VKPITRRAIIIPSRIAKVIQKRKSLLSSSWLGSAAKTRLAQPETSVAAINYLGA